MSKLACFIAAICLVLQNLAIHGSATTFIDQSRWWIKNSSDNSTITSVSFVEEMKDQPANGNNDKVDYLEFIRNAGYIVDKTLLIESIVNYQKKVIIIAYPRRFGKSLNLQMLASFLQLRVMDNGQKQDVKETEAYQLFQKGIIRTDEKTLHLKPKLKISEKKETTEKHLGQYPVIHISLLGLNPLSSSYSEFLISFSNMIFGVFIKHAYIFKILNEHVQNPNVTISQKKYAETMEPIFVEYSTSKANETMLISSLFFISQFLNTTFGKPVYILFDEYDFIYNYQFLSIRKVKHGPQTECEKKITDFLKLFFTATFKNNEYVERGIITGSLMLDKQDVLPGSNYVEDCNFHTEGINPYYGFLEGEVYELITRYAPGYKIPHFGPIKNLYDGYMVPSKGLIYPLYNPYVIGEFIIRGQLGWYTAESGSICNELHYFLTLQHFRESFDRCIRRRNFRNKTITVTYNEITPVISLKEGLAIREFMEECETTGITFLTQHRNVHSSCIIKLLYYKGYFTGLKNTCMIAGLPTTNLTLRIPNEEIRVMLYECYLHFLSNQLNMDILTVKDFANCFEQFIAIEQMYTAEEIAAKFELLLLDIIDPFISLKTFSRKAGRVVFGHEAVIHHILTLVTLHIECPFKEFDIRLPVSGNQPDLLFIWPRQVTIVVVKFDQTDAKGALNQGKKYTDHVLYEVLYRDKDTKKPEAFTFRYIGIMVTPLKNVSILKEMDSNVIYDESVAEDKLKSFRDKH